MGIFLLLVSGISTRVALWKDIDEVGEDIDKEIWIWDIIRGFDLHRVSLFVYIVRNGLLSLHLQGGSFC